LGGIAKAEIVAGADHAGYTDSVDAACTHAVLHAMPVANATEHATLSGAASATGRFRPGTGCGTTEI
jgi:hypothetical protein